MAPISPQNLHGFGMGPREKDAGVPPSSLEEEEEEEDYDGGGGGW